MSSPAPASAGRRLMLHLLSPVPLSALMLGACLTLTVGLWHGALADAEQDMQADFDFRVRELINNLDQRMQTYVQVLYGVQGLFDTATAVTRSDFRSYLAVQDLNAHFPGVQGGGYMQLVARAEVENHLAALHAE